VKNQKKTKLGKRPKLSKKDTIKPKPEKKPIQVDFTSPQCKLA